MSAWRVTLTASAAIVGLAGVYLARKCLIESSEAKRKRRTLEKLRKLQAIINDVVTKLDKLEQETEMLVASPEEQSAEGPQTSYYFFDSSGKKYNSKWDNFDVEAELAKVDEGNGDGTNILSEEAPANTSRSKQTMTSSGRRRSKLNVLRELNGVEKDFEDILAFLDTIQGVDDEVRSLRKQTAVKVNEYHLTKLDSLRQQLLLLP